MKSGRGIVMLAMGAGLVLGAVQAWGVDVYVDASWTGTQSGTQTEPFRTISNAVFYANSQAGGSPAGNPPAGSTYNLRIAGGTYTDVANGGLEDFSVSSNPKRADVAGGGYVLGWIDGTGLRVNVYGGYAGWDGDGTEASDFDWTELARVPRSTVIDLQGAGSRAFVNNLGHTADTGSLFDGLTIVNGNDTSGYGGGAIIDYAPVVGNSYKMQIYINNCLFTNNVSTVGGGAVRMHGFAAAAAVRSWIRNSEFIGNRTTKAIAVTGQQDGGGAVNYAQMSIISNCTFVANASTNFGGAVAGSTADSGTMFDSTFRDNVALGGGGAVYVYQGAFTIQRSIFEGNHAEQAGAAIGQNNYHGAYYTLINCLIADNTGGYAVGAGAHSGTGTYVLDMLHCTVVNNAGGGVFGFDQNGNDNPIRIRNSVIANNGAYGVFRHDINDPAAELSHNNVFGNTSGNYYQATADANSISADPKFADAGGGDYLLLAGSPSRDAAFDYGVTVDLLGNARPFNEKDEGIDQGCYEHEPPPKGTVIAIQ